MHNQNEAALMYSKEDFSVVVSKKKHFYDKKFSLLLILFTMASPDIVLSIKCSNNYLTLEFYLICMSPY